MKKKFIVILLTIALLAGREAALATAQENALDIDTIVQRSEAKAIAQYEEAQKEKNAEIAGLKAQLEKTTSQAEENSNVEGTPDVTDPPETAPPEENPLLVLPASRRSRNSSLNLNWRVSTLSLSSVLPLHTR